jgi:hypothetical protein
MIILVYELVVVFVISFLFLSVAKSSTEFSHLMQAKELDMLIIHMGMELNLHKTLCHFLVAQLQDLKPNVSRKH